jgi:hypothetical protein
MTEGWGTWHEDRRYPAKDGEHEIIVWKRTQKYGDAEKVFWKNERRKVEPPKRDETFGH